MKETQTGTTLVENQDQKELVKLTRNRANLAIYINGRQVLNTIDDVRSLRRIFLHQLHAWETRGNLTFLPIGPDHKFVMVEKGGKLVGRSGDKTCEIRADHKTLLSELLEVERHMLGAESEPERETAPNVST